MEMKFSYMKFLFFLFLWWHHLHNFLVVFFLFCIPPQLCCSWSKRIQQLPLRLALPGCGVCQDSSIELSLESAGRLEGEQPKSQLSLESFSQAQSWQSDHHRYTDISSKTANKCELSSLLTSCELCGPCSRHVLSSRQRQEALQTQGIYISISVCTLAFLWFRHTSSFWPLTTFHKSLCASQSDTKARNASGLWLVLCYGRSLYSLWYLVLTRL